MKRAIISFLIIFLTGGILYGAGNSPVAPTVSIISPQDGTAINQNIVSVTVSFKSSANPTEKTKTNTGNVSLVVLNIDGVEVSRYENPPNIKEGNHTFSLDISNYPDSIITLQAFAYHGNINAGLVSQSNIVSLIIDHIPPVATATLTPQPNTFGWNNTDVTVHFDATDNLSGVVSVTPDITLTQEVREQVVTGNAQDKAGNTGGITAIVNIDKTLPQIAITSPANGTTLDTNTPLIRVTYSDNLSGINLTSLLITINGVDHTSEFTIGDGEATLQILSNNPLPEGQNTIIARSQDKAGNISEATSIFIVATIPPIEPPPVTPYSGYIHGKVSNSRTDEPLSGALVTADGIEGEMLTDSEGKFAFPISNFPPTNVTTAKLTIKKDGFTYAQREAEIISTRDTAVDDVYLTPLDTQVTTIGLDGGTATNSTGRVRVVFPEGAISEPIPVIATQYEGSKELPSQLPSTSFFTYAIDLQPDGVSFNEPVKVEIANHLGFSPGTPIPVGVWNPNLFKWEHESMAYVSSDGSKVEFYVEHFSPRDINLPVVPPPPQARPSDVTANFTADNVDTTKECGSNVSSTIGVKSGSLLIEENLPSIRSLGMSNSLNFTYNSSTANPSQIIATETNLDPVTTIIPQRTNWKLNIEGNLIDVRFDGVSGGASQRYLFDGKNGRGEYLKTGSYPYEINISNEYTANFATTNVFGGPPLQDTGVPSTELIPFTTTIKGRTIINNQIESSYGSGWGMGGLQRLHKDPDGDIVIADGDGSTSLFNRSVFAYIVKDDGIIVIDTKRDIVLEQIQIGGIPLAIVITPDQKFAYVAREGFTDDIVVLDLNTNSIVTIIPFPTLFAGPPEIAISDDGKFVYVLNSSTFFGFNSGVYVIDTSNNSFIANIPVRGQATDIKVTPDNKSIYITSVAIINNQLAGAVTVVDATNNIVLREMTPLGYFLMSLDISPDSARVYVLDFGRVFVIDTIQIEIIDMFDSWVSWTVNSSIAITPDGNFAYIVGKHGMAVVSLTTRNLVSLISTNNFMTVEITPDGNFAYVAAITDFVPTIFVIDTKTNAIVRTLRLGGHNFRSDTNTLIDMGISLNKFSPPFGDFSSLVRNDDNTYTRTMKDGTKINFNSDGLQTSTIDRNNNITTYEYIDANNDGKVEEFNKITLPTGQIYTFTYDGNGKLASVTDPAGRATQFTIDINCNLTQIVYSDGSNKSFTYDANHLMLTQRDPRGDTTEYIYDEYGKIKETKSPFRDIASVDALGNVTVSRDQEVHQFQPQDVIGLINDIPLGEGTETNPAPVVRPETVRYTASEGCNCAGTNGQTDKFGSATNVTDALGRITSIERDIEGNPTKITRPNGAVTSMSYDTKGNLLTVTEQSISATTTFTYESTYNQVTSIKDPKENTTTITYDGKGNPIQIKDVLNNPTTLTYDTRGLLTSVKDTLNNTTSFTYDPIAGNLTLTTDPLNNTTILTYDTAGNVIASQDAEGRITTFSYDNMNRLTSVTDADSKTTSYQYDLAGNLTKVIDAKGNETQFVYNETNQLIQTVNPLGRSEYFQYDANRNIAATINRNGDTIAFGYDLVNQLIKKYLPGNQVTAFNYDNVGNLSGVTDPDSVLSFTYDLANRLSSTSTTGSPYQPVVTLTYGYDKNGNRISMVDPTGTTSYVYDTLNRLTSLTNPSNQTTGFDYDALSRRRTLTHANGTSTSYAYDGASQLTSLVNALGPTTISGFDYTYDKIGNRTTMTELAGVNNYGYDVLNRLLSATHQQVENPTESFSYDAVGNRLTSHLSNSYTYDIANRLLEDNTYLYTYDDNGNMTEKIEKSTSKIIRYYYDAENQLIAITLPDDTLDEYRYDGLSRRIEKKITPSADPVTTTRYIYDNEDILLEYDATNTLIVYYTHGPGIDEPLIMRQSGVDYYYHVDGLGSVKELTDAIGSVVQTYTYDTFGKIVIQTGTITNPYTYTSREYDPESGLYYYRARYYDPTIGRFITKDPLGFIDGPNLYLYLSNDPVTGIDPWGLARLRVRPLEAIEWTTIGPLQHEQFFYEDGKNSGYFPSKDKEGGYIGPDTSKLRNKYKTAKGYENLDDEILRQAEKNIRDEWLKEKFGPFHDCQAYRRAAMKEYNKLMKEKTRRAKCN